MSLSDNVNNTRSLSVMTVLPGRATLENCTTACFNYGFRFSGAEYSTYANFLLDAHKSLNFDLPK